MFHMKFRTKLYIAFLVVMIFALVSFSLFIQYRIFGQIESESTYNDLQLCIKISENVDAYVEKLDDITKKIIANATLQSVLKRAEEATFANRPYEVLSSNRALAEIVSNATTLTSFPLLNIYLYSESGGYRYVYNQDNSRFPQALENEASVDLLQKKRMVIFPYNEHTPGYDGKASVSFIRSIFDIKAKLHGYVEIQDNYGELNQICDINQIGDVIILDGQGRTIYPAAEGTQPVPLALYDGSRQGVWKDGAGNVYFHAFAPYSGFTVFIRYSVSNVFASLDLLRRTTYSFLGGVSVLAFVLVFLSSKMLVKPLLSLRDSVMNVSYENMGLAVEPNDNDEIKILGDAFQGMLENLKSAADKEIAATQAEERARFSALQARIAPHFIHNVLYTISICAQEGRREDAVSMCKQLSDMLRYTVNAESQTVRMEEEIACVRNYLSLQAQFYEDFLTYEVSLSQDVLEVIVPRLSILPFVENVVQHAFNQRKPPYWIAVKGKRQGDRWQVLVEDNGNGFGQEKLEEIQQMLRQPTFSNKPPKADEPGMFGMGVVNTVLRWQLLYGSDFVFQIGNHQGGGASIQLEGSFEATKPHIDTQEGGSSV